jgi:serine protease AprX
MSQLPTGQLQSSLSELANRIDFCRLSPGGTERAALVNNSYNTFFDPALNGGYYFADNQYGSLASFFDSKVLDGHTTAGAQPTTLVFSAGNYAYWYPTGAILRDSVASPATAKNVITVGASASYRPAPEPPLPCSPLTSNQRPPNHDAVHIARVGSFSGRGKSFFAAPNPTMVHQVRVKPDLVAPGIRVFSTAPYFSPPNYTLVSGCLKYYPDPAVALSTFHTYGTGTSFAAPVVTGVAALKRKWFLDRGVSPSPSLIKAALIATADSLGSSGLTGNDHRPSSNSGWGRVNLNRLTDSRSRFYVTDNQGLAVTTGTVRSWTRTIGNPAVDTFIVLTWSDPPSVLGSSQVPLANNLRLSVEEVGSSSFWRGNNFRENLAGDDNS